ncbi:hypothetical protein WN51_02225 [Melipona quadrifasciata]|uniref:Uncharacterized protein n=1 Tax=Melipona quadrifasciata TaxID=166423 RepID=A0A0N0U485_9HYME|nr:hypothetical protein WN51_02225 [Melipona quadrifasciata]
MLDDRNYPWLASIVDPTGLCGHINNVLQLIQPTYRSASRADAAVSIDAFLLLLFAETRQTARMSVVRTLGARFVSRVHACLSGWHKPAGLPKWIHGRTGFASNAHANRIATHPGT